MSGRAKTVLYRIFDWAIWLGAVGGAVALFLLTPALDVAEYVAGNAVILLLALRFPSAVHEVGHLFFGACCGMGVRSVTMFYLNFSRRGVKFAGMSYAGETELYPKSERGVRTKLLLSTAGGCIFNMVIGGVCLALYLAFPYHPALLFCGMTSLFLLGEGLRAAVPAHLPEGDTDGARFLSVLRRDREGEVLLAVLTAEGYLYRGTFADIPRALLFETPVVREDEPAFAALLQLRMLFSLHEGNLAEANASLERLRSLYLYLPEEEQANIERYAPCFEGLPPEGEGERSPFRGLNELEERLKNRE